MELLHYSIFDGYSSLIHFCTTRSGGVSTGNYAEMNLGITNGDNPDLLKQNLQILASHLDIDVQKIIIPYQTHQSNVKIIDKDFFLLTDAEKSAYLHGVDALITTEKKVCIGVTTADCVPLTFFDSEKQVVAVAHAGWRGTCAKIAAITVEKLVDTYGCALSNLKIAIGPCISQEVYATGKEVADAFSEAGFPVDKLIKYSEGKYYLDLKEANRWLLMQSGIQEENIEVSEICTFTQSDKYFSSRKHGFHSGRMLSGIMLKN